MLSVWDCEKDESVTFHHVEDSSNESFQDGEGGND